MLEDWQIALIVIGSSVVAYSIASAILLRCKPLPYTRRDPRFGFVAKKIAHRGGSMIGPENTLLTFHRAAKHDHVDMIELDVHITSDGVVVVSHDDSFERICRCQGSIHETPFSGLPPMAKVINLHFRTPTESAYRMPDADEAEFGLQPFCTLRQVFEAFPTLPLHVDAKYVSPLLVEKVLALIDEFDRSKITVVGSGGGENTKLIREDQERRRKMATTEATSLKRDHPNSKPLITFASAPEVMKTIALYYLGLLPLVPVDYDVFDIPLPTQQMKGLLKNYNCLIGNLAGFLLNTPKLWRHLQSRGIRVYGFVLNSSLEIEEVADWPIDGIMTDDPNLFANAPSAIRK